MTVIPLNDKILVERVEAEEKTAGGIVLPDTAREKPKQGKVLSTGEGKVLESGKRQPFQVGHSRRMGKCSLRYQSRNSARSTAGTHMPTMNK